MKNIEHDQLLIRQYLLGELNEDQREQLEQRVITDRDYKEEVQITEEELLEDFVGGALPARERELFLKRYTTSPGQLRKVQIAKALNKYSAVHPIVPPSGPSETTWIKSLLKFFYKGDRFSRFALASVFLLFFAAGSFFIYSSISRDESANYAALMRLNAPESELMQLDNATVVSVTLSSLLLRGTGEPKTVTINKQTQTVQFRLADPSGGTAVFRVTLKDSGGSKVFTLEDLHSRRLGQLAVLVLQIPAAMLQQQEYQLEISERKPDGTYANPAIYSFQVQDAP
jgi:hypothetical protein